MYECVRFGFPLSETFAKLSGTAIVCSDSQSAKLDFAIDSRLRGNDGDGCWNDGRFCKGLFRGNDDKRHESDDKGRGNDGRFWEGLLWVYGVC